MARAVCCSIARSGCARLAREGVMTAHKTRTPSSRDAVAPPRRRGSFVVSERDGLAVDSNVQIGVPRGGGRRARASLHRKSRLACGAAGCGAVTFLRSTPSAVGSAPPAAMTSCWCTISEARANIGLLRVEMMRAAKALT
jgi:hypothetical protein